MQFLETAQKHIRRSPYQAVAAIMVMTLTFIAVSVFTLLILGSSVVINYFESKPQVTAFFKDEASQENIDALRSQVEGTGLTSGVKFVSKEEALEIYRQQNRNDPLLLDLVTADILPASLEVSTQRIEDLGEVSEVLKSSSYVQEVIFQQDVVEVLNSWTTAIRRIGIALILVLALVSTFIIVTVIGIKISHKKEEIEIMQLLGATKWYIRWPFIFEGVFYAVLGAFVGWLISSIALFYSSPFLSSFLQGIPLFPVPLIFYAGLLGFELLLALLLGFFSSYLAVLRYLK